MTASQEKRIRTKLERAAKLTAEANELARDGHADYTLRELTAAAADDMTAALRAHDHREQRFRQNAEAIARSLKQ